MHQCKSISVLSGSSPRFTVHHHIFRQPKLLHLLGCSLPLPLSPGPAQRSCHPECAAEHKLAAAPAAALAPWRWSKNTKLFSSFSNKLGQIVPRPRACVKCWFSYFCSEFILLLLYFDVLGTQLNAELEHFFSPEVKHLKAFRWIPHEWVTKGLIKHT